MTDDERLRVTIDTNLLDDAGMRQLASVVQGHSVSVALVTVSQREMGRSIEGVDVFKETAVWDESRWGDAVWDCPVSEPLVLDESPLGSAVLGSELSLDRFEEIIRIISNGSFPKRGEREALKSGQRRQLRDAMILEAHARESRDVLVTKDVTGFIKDGRRDELQRLCSTRIMTPDEFRDFLNSQDPV